MNRPLLHDGTILYYAEAAGERRLLEDEIRFGHSRSIGLPAWFQLSILFIMEGM